MLPAIATKHFGMNQEYLVKRYSRGGERRIMQGLALALTVQNAPAPLLNTLDGDSRYWEEVFKECLVDAPAHWWEPTPPEASTNGTPSKRLSFEQVTVEEFNALSQEVQRWFDSFRLPDDTHAPGDRTPEPVAVVAPETVSTTFRGVAS